MTDSTATPTIGEQRVLQILKRLDQRRYYFKQEPRLITANNSSKPDFIVLDAMRGVIIIEVKDWVEITAATQETFEVRRRTGEVVSHTNPYVTAEHYAYDLKELFETKPELWERYKNKKRLIFPWQPLVILPHISQAFIRRLENAGIVPIHAVIGGEVLKNPATLEEAFDHLPWKFKLEGLLNRDVREIIRGILDPELIVEDKAGRQVGPLTVVQETLVKEPVRLFTPQQMTLTEELPESAEPGDEIQVRLIRGVAGSGKTLVILKRARWLHERYPDAKVLVLTFNRNLADELRRRLGGNCTVVNFHKLCKDILEDVWQSPLKKQTWLDRNVKAEMARLGLPVEFVAEEMSWRVEESLLTDDAYLSADRTGRGYRLEQSKRQIINTIFNRYITFKQASGPKRFDWEDVPFLAEERLRNPHHPLRAAYDAVLVDEAQDFTPSWIRVVRLLLKPAGFLSLCDDPTQGIFHNYNWKQKNVAVVGRTRILQIPFRSTFEISAAAHALVDADEILSSSEERTRPDFTSYELSNGPIPDVVLCSDTHSEILAITNRVENLIDDDVPEHHIAILCHHWEQTGYWAALKERGVFVDSFDRSKGLEFQAVFIPHLHLLFSPDDDAEVISAKRRKIFMAMTRARHALFLSAEQALPEPLSPILGSVNVESIAEPV